MKILSSSQMQQADQATINQQKISSTELMERAANKLYSRLIADYVNSSAPYYIICGPGNNGGDGLVLGRLLSINGYTVHVYLLEASYYSADNIINQRKLTDLSISLKIFKQTDPFVFPKNAIVVDALFGHGLNRPLDQSWQSVITQINDATRVVSIDMPSGLLADKPTAKNMPIVHADITYTFDSPKLALLLPDNALYSMNFQVIDIALDEIFKHSLNNTYEYLTLSLIQSFRLSNTRFAHKGTFGHTLIAGGSRGKIGSVLLASKAALRAGTGLSTCYLPACGYEIIQTAVPEAMVECDSDLDYLVHAIDQIERFDAVAIGMGMGQTLKSETALHALLHAIHRAQKKTAMLLDADALNILSQQPQWLNLLPANTILTPHPKELNRLIGAWENDFEKLTMATDFAKKHQLIIVIKGANSAIVLPDGKIYFNATGNWGMATGGSGDVLSGIIASLLAQGFPAAHATLTGVYLHGLAADKTIAKIHPKSLIASDIINSISEAWEDIIPIKHNN